jgi:hypothetical protein
VKMPRSVRAHRLTLRLEGQKANDILKSNH